MKKFLSLAMCLCAMLVAISSCSKSNSDNPLIGKWEQTIEQSGAEIVAIYEFFDNGELEQSMTIKSDVVNIEGSGTCEYIYENGTITFKFSGDDFDYSTFEIEGLSDDMAELAIEQAKAELVDVEQTFTDVEINGDVMTANFNGQSVTLNRI